MLRQEKGHGAEKLITEFTNKQWTLSGLNIEHTVATSLFNVAHRARETMQLLTPET